ncbi:YceI family protein [Ferruginibacter paludis]|uniref:YceI family protein n=1 Tax=Ferruginibacter paludis TaxID=1310417 RepID=UPI0025B3308F|nr:YceI family protein [Ferruginibacter paludis]MDN3656105.1 YceI family protein [Ferruginibacter paludis]
MSQKTKWEIDPTHAEIGFKVKHMMFTNVSGKIGKYSAIIETDEDDFTNAVIDFTGDTDSVTTGNADRDAHLISPDFFDAAQFPKINFVATSFLKVDIADFELTGDLTLHGVTKPIKLAVEFGGLMKDPWGNIKAAFNIEGKINRKDWGLSWNAALEAGGVLVGEEVKIIAEIELIKK